MSPNQTSLAVSPSEVDLLLPEDEIKKPHGFQRWLILTLCGSMMLGVYYVLAMPAALHRSLYETMPSQNFEMNFNMIFAFSYFPNMVLPLFGGALADSYGEATCMAIYSAIISIGQVFTTVGVSLSNWFLLLMGRTIFGLGAQTLMVADAAFITKWFSGSLTASALAILNVFGYAGVILTNIANPVLASLVNTSFAMFIGVVFSLFSLATAFAILSIDRSYSSLKKQEEEDFEIGEILLTTSPERDKFRLTNVFKFKKMFWLLCVLFLLVYGLVWSFTNVSSALLLERDFFKDAQDGCSLKFPHNCTSGYLAPKDGNPATDSFGHSCPADSYAPILPKSLNIAQHNASWHKHVYEFDSLSSSDVNCNDPFWYQACTKDYCEKQTMAIKKTGLYMSIPYIFTISCLFYFGIILDKTGWYTQMICFGCILLVITHTMLMSLSISPEIPLSMQGLGYTICIAALWPAIPLTVDERDLGTAFGVMMCMQNVGLAIVPLVVAKLYEYAGGQYIPEVEAFFVLCAILSVFVSFVLFLSEKKH